MVGDDDKSTPQTSLDSTLSTPTKESRAPREKYKGRVASKHTPLPDTSEGNKRSWTMGEVDRIVSSDIIPSSNKSKLAQFGMNLNRKNDFRLQDFSSRLSSSMRRDFSSEMAKGRVPERIREFDIQAQSMRMITANATLGSLQFNKTQMLPYMRKSLSLGYQKVDILKRISGGISSLEKNLLIKLEAIKINTSVPDIEKTSMFTKLKDDVKSHVMKKIAANIGHRVLQGYDETYKKYVTPILSRAHTIMHDDDPKSGGINGIIRSAAYGLNSVRHKAREIATSEARGSTLGRIKSGAARVAAGALGPVIKVGQHTRLPGGTNKFVSGFMKSKLDFVASLDPFATGVPKSPLEAVKEHLNPTEGSHLGFHKTEGQSYGGLNTVVRDWRLESRKVNTTIIDHLKAIRHNTSVADDGTRKKGSVRGPHGTSRKLPFRGIRDTVESSQIHSHPDGGVSSIDPMVGAATTSAATESIIDRIHNLRKRAVSSSLPGMKPHLEVHTKRLHGILNKLSEHVHNFHARIQSPPAQINTPHSKTTISHRQLSTHATKILGGMKHILGKLSGSRGKLLSSLSKHKVANATGSIPEHNPAGTNAPGGIGHIVGGVWNPTPTKGGRSAPISHSDDAHGGILSSMWDVAKGGLGAIGLDMLSSGILGKFISKGPKTPPTLKGRIVKGAAKLAWKGAKAVPKAYVGGTKLLAKGAYKAVTKGVPLGYKAAKVGVPLAWKGGKMAAGLAGRGALGAGKLAGGLALSGAGAVGRGALSVAKSPIGIGIGATIGKHYIDKYTTGGVKRVGDTVADMAQYGALGAELGGPWGAAIGAGVGLLVANSDLIAKGFGSVAHGVGWLANGINTINEKTYGILGGPLDMLATNWGTISKGLGYMGNTISSGASHLWTSIFGQSAKIRPNGVVDRQEKDGILGNIKAAFFGEKAKYNSKSGNLIKPGSKSYIASIQKTLADMMFGGKNPKGKSTVSMIGDSLSNNKKSSDDKDKDKDNNHGIAFKAWEGLKSVGSSIGSTVSNAASSVGSALSSAGSAIASGASAVGSAISSGAQSATKWVGGKITSLSSALDKIMMDYEGGAKIITDTGGLTKYGISAKGNPGIDIKNLTQDKAKDIYMKKYVTPLGLDKYSPAAAFIAMDASINQGLGYAKKLLASTGGDPGKMIDARRKMYADLAAKNPGKYGKYLKGWNNRMDKLTRDAGGASMASASPTGTTPSSGAKSPSGSAGGSDFTKLGSGASLTAPSTSKSGTFSSLASSSTPAATAAFGGDTSGKTPASAPVQVAQNKPSPTPPVSIMSQPSAVSAPITTPKVTPVVDVTSAPDKSTPKTPKTKSKSDGGSDMAKLIAQLAQNAEAINRNTDAILKSGSGPKGATPASASGSSSTTTPGTTSSEPVNTGTQPQPVIIPITNNRPNGSGSQPPQLVMSMKKSVVQTGVMA